MAYMAILILLAILSTLTFSFLFKVGTQTSAAMNRGQSMQPRYLAESAANHALWRLLNDPGFPASGTVYYMHDLVNGRYGYKVRKPTLTTFATVATVGAMGNTVIKQSYVQYLKPFNVVTTYERNGGVDIPVFRQLLGATWVDPADTLNVGPNDSQYMVLKGCPIRKELIMGTLDSANDINFAVWDGTTWGNLIEFTQDTGSFVYQCFDIAYENQSGDTLVVGRYDDNQSTRYNIWDGTAWAFATPQEDATLQTGSNLAYIDMASKPNSDEILIAKVDLANDLQVVQWDGAAFNDQGEIDDDMATNGYGSVEVVYEQQSGDALVLWSHKNSGQIYCSVWSGASLSPVAMAPDFGKPPNVIRAAADPNSNYIFVAAIDTFNDLNVAVWDGNAWIDNRELDIATFIGPGQIVDVAWEHSGEEVVVAWADWLSSNISFFTWQKGTALSDHTVQTGPDFQQNPFKVRLHPIAGTQKILLLVRTNSRALRYSIWTGNAFLGDPPILLESDLGLGALPFDIAEFGGT